MPFLRGKHLLNLWIATEHLEERKSEAERSSVLGQSPSPKLCSASLAGALASGGWGWGGREVKVESGKKKKLCLHTLRDSELGRILLRKQVLVAIWKTERSNSGVCAPAVIAN